MKELIKLLKELHEMHIKMRWLKLIDKETNKYNKLNEKTKRQCFIINELLKAYNENFGENLRKGSNK